MLLLLLFSAEAVHLAKDFQMVCDNDFPATQLADHVTRQNIQPAVVPTRMHMIDATL